MRHRELVSDVRSALRLMKVPCELCDAELATMIDECKCGLGRRGTRDKVVDCIASKIAEMGVAFSRERRSRG